MVPLVVDAAEEAVEALVVAVDDMVLLVALAASILVEETINTQMRGLRTIIVHMVMIRESQPSAQLAILNRLRLVLQMQNNNNILAFPTIAT